MNKIPSKSIAAIAASIQIPESAYEKAEARYEDLGKWFNRSDSECRYFEPHIYSQGSFRLGTVVRPMNEDGDFDLDVGCRLRSGITTDSHTQAELVETVREELEGYRRYRHIEYELEKKHRCWRLQYKDDLNFHMDIVPSIPAENQKRGLIKEAMIRSQTDASLAEKVTSHAGAITDDRDSSYTVKPTEWRISNSEGYALWFESRVALNKVILEKVARARVDRLPDRQVNSVLQLCIQVLKRHRDIMFESLPDSKPISIIITTLAGLAYSGESDVDSAISNIVDSMDSFVKPTGMRIPNPVNPENEDFADKWPTEEGQKLKLEENFWKWLKQAKGDFSEIQASEDKLLLEKRASEKFRTKLSSDVIEEVVRNNSLRSKHQQILSGAKTSAAGVIGSEGIQNKPHKFYGE